MPEEEKKKKHFKAVTEEVSASSTSEEPMKEEDTKEEIVEPIEEKDTDKNLVSVPHTDNISIDHNLKKDKGIFLKLFLTTFLATLLAFLLAGGIYVYLNGIHKLPTPDTSDNGTSNMPSSTPEATSTPTPTVDLSTFKISTLNGNGGVGVASGAKVILEKAGFTVSNAGNAGSYDFTDTVVQVKSTVPDDVVAKLKDALSAKYSIKMGDNLEDTDTYDVVVTVGSK